MSGYIEKFFIHSLNLFRFLVYVPSSKSINSSSLPRKRYDALFLRLEGIRDSLATADLICWE